MKSKPILVVLTGAGISQESGIPTFRDMGGLWHEHNLEDVASPEGFRKNPKLVLDFYNERRRKLKEVVPNEGHLGLKALEADFEVKIITQNVDDLHERAGSTSILHLHGRLNQVRSVRNPNLILDTTEDINLGDLAPDGAQLRPNIVWFGESVPLIIEARQITETAHIFAVIGTALTVYPAAALLDFVPAHVPIYVIDPQPPTLYSQPNSLHYIPKKAVEGVAELRERLLGK